MSIEYSISDESIIETREMIQVDKQNHSIPWDLICFAEITIKNDVYSKKNVHLSRMPFFLFMEELKYFWDEKKIPHMPEQIYLVLTNFIFS